MGYGRLVPARDTTPDRAAHTLVTTSTELPLLLSLRASEAEFTCLLLSACPLVKHNRAPCSQLQFKIIIYKIQGQTFRPPGGHHQAPLQSVREEDYCP
jgi:hypothetical protein